MDVSFSCSKCGQNIVIDEAGAGQSIRCPTCGNSLVVPSKPKPAVGRYASLPQPADSSEMKPCPFCAELIKTKAKVCRFCGNDLGSGKPMQAPQTGTSPTPRYLPASVRKGLIIVAVALVGFAGYLFWRNQRRQIEAPLFVAAEEAVDEAHAFKADLYVISNRQEYRERLAKLEAKIEKLDRLLRDPRLESRKHDLTIIELDGLKAGLYGVHTYYSGAQVSWFIKDATRPSAAERERLDAEKEQDQDQASAKLSEVDSLLAKIRARMGR